MICASVACALAGLVLASCGAAGDAGAKGAAVKTSANTIAKTYRPRSAQHVMIPSLLLHACTQPRVLEATGAEPTMPNGFRMLDALRNWLGDGFPTIYGGTAVNYDHSTAHPLASGAIPKGYLMPSTLTVFETQRDPLLEAEAQGFRVAYKRVVFLVSAHSKSCLAGIVSSLQLGKGKHSGSYPWGRIESAGIDPVESTVDVGVSACTAGQERRAMTWFEKRYGSAIAITFCEAPGIAGVAGQTQGAG